MTEKGRFPQLIILSLILPTLIMAGLLFYNDSSSELASESNRTADKDIFLMAPSNLVSASPQPVTKASGSVLNLLFFGDLMLDRHVGEKLIGHNLDYLLGGLASSTPKFFAGYDLISANLEGAVTTGGVHYPPVMSYDFAFKPERVGELKKYNFDFFNIANNHVSDQGEVGLRETRRELTGLQFDYSGTLDAVVNEYSVKIVERSGKKIALIGLSMAYHDFDLAAATKLIDESKKQADLVIVNVHWGTEYQHQFNKHQQAVGRALIDAGADLIIGHHPHVVQGLEVYKNRLIFYSLGNFIFDQYFSADTQQGLAVGLKIEDGKISASLFPLQAKSAVVSLMSGPAKDIFLAHYAGWSIGDNNLKAGLKDQLIEIKR